MDIDLAGFCGDGDSPLWCRQPWSDERFSYASDGAVLVRVARDPAITKNAHAPNIEQCEDLQKALSQNIGVWRAVPEFVSKQEECGECDGSGRAYGERCEYCGGTGSFEISEEIAIGEAVFFSTVLKRIRDLPEVRICVLSKEGPARFVFAGGDGIIMPLRNC